MSIRLEDIMTDKIQVIHPNTSAETAWNRMRAQKIHHFLVKEDNEVVGVVSERDLGGKNGAEIRRNKRVQDLMTPDPITAHPKMTLKDAINELRGFTIGCIPIMEGTKLVGIVTLTDLLEQISRGMARTAVQKERKPAIGIPIYRRPGHPPIS